MFFSNFLKKKAQEAWKPNIPEAQNNPWPDYQPPGTVACKITGLLGVHRCYVQHVPYVGASVHINEFVTGRVVSATMSFDAGKECWYVSVE